MVMYAMHLKSEKYVALKDLRKAHYTNNTHAHLHVTEGENVIEIACCLLIFFVNG